jgi:hypothetical protein
MGYADEVFEADRVARIRVSLDHRDIDHHIRFVYGFGHVEAVHQLRLGWLDLDPFAVVERNDLGARVARRLGHTRLLEVPIRGEADHARHLAHDHAPGPGLDQHPYHRGHHRGIGGGRRRLRGHHVGLDQHRLPRTVNRSSHRSD